MGKIVAVTGHRPDKLGGYSVPNPTYSTVVARLREKILFHLRPRGSAQAPDTEDCLISGCAQGIDQWSMEICINADIPFVAALPMDFEAFSSRWPPTGKAKLRFLLSKAHQVLVVSPGVYELWKMQARNVWMVDNCHVLLTAWNGSKGGTANCVGYAQEVQREIDWVEVPPDSTVMQVREPAPINQWIEEQARARQSNFYIDENGEPRAVKTVEEVQPRYVRNFKIED